MDFIAIQPGVLPLADYIPVGSEVQCPRCATCFRLCAKAREWTDLVSNGERFISVACAKLRCDLAVSCCGFSGGHCLLEFTDVSRKEAMPPSQ